MEIEWEILNSVMDMREKTRCNKFVGALTVELVREALQRATQR